MSGDKEYYKFMEKVDDLLNERLGFSHDDLPDYIWYTRYQNGDTPEEAVKAYEDSGYLE